MALVRNQFEVVGDLILSGASVTTYFEPIGLLPPVRTVTIPGGLMLSGENITIPSQTLSLSGSMLTLSDGNDIDLALALPELDIQTLTLTDDIVSISRGNTIDLSDHKQTLSLSGNSLIISSGNTIDLSSMQQDLTISGTELTITSGNTVDLGFLADELDNQTLSLSGNTLMISNGNQVDLSTTQPDLVSLVFVTDIVNNSGLVDINYVSGTVPEDLIVNDVTIDNDSDLNIVLEWDGPAVEWMGEVYINDVIVENSDISRIGLSRRFTADVNIDLNGDDVITVTGNGGSHSIPVTLVGAGPSILDVSFSEPPTHSGSQQAMFLDGDDVEITIIFDSVDVTSVSLDGGNDTSTRSVTDHAVTAVDNGDGTSSVILTEKVDTTLSTTTDVPVKISAKNSFGTEGDEHTSTATIPVRQGPEVTGVTFGSYPGIQTELKDNDIISMTVTFDTNNVSQVQLQSGGNYASASQTKNVNPNTLSASTTITIDTSVTSAQNQPIRIRARGGSNNYGNYINSVDTLKVNNVSPTFTNFTVSYPDGQSALRGTESADVSLTISNTGASPQYEYIDPRSDIIIPGSTSYTQTKTVTCTNPGLYNITHNNFKVTVNRSENNNTSVFTSGIIFISDILPVISVSTPYNSLRSGGDENTSPQVYQIVVTSNQRLHTFNMSPYPSAGVLLGQWVSSNDTSWRANLQVSDSDSKGEFDWVNISGSNLSHMIQDSIISGDTYTLGGFVQRNLQVSALSRTRTIGTSIEDPSKLSVTETFRGSISFDDSIPNGATLDPDISTGIDINSMFTIVDQSNPTVVDYNGDTIFYLDRVAVNNNVSGTSIMSVEEII